MKNSWVLRIALIASFTIITLYFFPWKHTLSLEGVKFQIGDENKSLYESVTITMDGRMYKNINGTKKFRGALAVEDEIISETNISRPMEIAFDKNNYANLTFTTTYGQSIHYGDMFMNKNFDELIIRIYEKKDLWHTTWDEKNGTIISAPAKNRDEALGIYNKLKMP